MSRNTCTCSNFGKVAHEMNEATSEWDCDRNVFTAHGYVGSCFAVLPAFAFFGGANCVCDTFDSCVKTNEAL